MELTPITAIQWADLSTDQKTAAITALVALGQSCKQMGVALGTTKNAILSHASRYEIGLAVSTPATRLRKAKGKPTPAKAPVRFRSYPPLPAATWAAHRPGVSLVDLEDRQCRWPVGEDEGSKQLFCGDHSGRHSYCGHHRVMASSGKCQKSQ